jgi:hypothetical protein
MYGRQWDYGVSSYITGESIVAYMLCYRVKIFFILTNVLLPNGKMFPLV